MTIYHHCLLIDIPVTDSTGPHTQLTHIKYIFKRTGLITHAIQKKRIAVGVDVLALTYKDYIAVV